MDRLPPLSDLDKSLRPSFPWYKKRLLPKYLKGLNDKLYLSDALNGRHWQFLQRGMDDFRDGFPLPSESACVKQPKGPAPLLNNVPEASDTVKKSPRKRFTAYQAYVSKLLPLQQARRDYIAAIEYSLSQHPLALYPHLEESVPPQMFEKVVNILDAELQLSSEEHDITKEEEREWCIPKRTEVMQVCMDTSTRHSIVSEESKLKNPYTWFSKKEEAAEDDKHTRLSSPPTMDKNVKRVTKEFCDWVSSLGGEHFNIDEATLLNLFACGYETKPALSAPIHVVELNNVPAKLRTVLGGPLPQSPLAIPYRKDEWQTKGSQYPPRWEKTKYGAWYLDPHTWKKLKANESLQDPNAGTYGVAMNLLQQLDEKDEELMKLHSTAAFTMFIDKKGYRRPEFLMKFFNPTPECLDGITSKFSTMNLSKKTRWYRAESASTQEDSVVN